MTDHQIEVTKLKQDLRQAEMKLKAFDLLAKKIKSKEDNPFKGK